MPYLSIIDPLRASRLRQQGYVELPNGEFGSREEYDRRVREAGQRLAARRERNAHRNAPVQDQRSIGRRFSDFVAQNVDANTVRQIREYNNNPFVNFGMNYALGDFAAQNPILGLLFSSIVSGGIAGATTGNPVVAAGVAAKNVATGAIDAWQKHKAVEAAEKEKKNFDDSEVLYYNEKDFPKRPSEEEETRETKQGYENLSIEPQTGNEALLTEIFRQENALRETVPSGARGFQNLQIQRTNNFSIIPQMTKSEKNKNKRARPLNALSKYSPLAVLFNGSSNLS